MIETHTTGYLPITTFRRSGSDPVIDASTSGFEARQSYYRFCWHLYANTIFEDLLKWVAYKQKYRHYRNVRSIYNPVARLVNAYAGTVYGGVLTDDGLPLPDGTPSAVPLDPNTSDLLRGAAVQVWKWSNFQAGKSLMVRYGAALGDVFVEVIDDVFRQKTWLQTWWPGFITNLDLDPQGNVESYTLEYEVRPAKPAGYGVTRTTERPYIYKKVVDRYSIQYFKNNKPFDYGQGEVVETFYGFCPAVWINHSGTGGVHGANAWEGSQAKLEELNALASRIHDQIHKSVASPRIFWTNSKITSLLDQTKRPASEVDEVKAPDADRESVMLLKGPAEGRTESLLGTLDIGSSLPYLQQLVTEIEADHPEINMWRELRAMQQVTGPGAVRLVGDTAPKFLEAGANYDRGLLAATQMAIAIGGERIRLNEWGTTAIPRQLLEDPSDEVDPGKLSRHQEVFKNFNLDSWDKGELDMTILPRSILSPTIDEKLAQAQIKQGLGVDNDTLLTEIGYSSTQMARIKANKKKEQQTAIEQQQAMFSQGGGAPFGGGGQQQ